MSSYSATNTFEEGLIMDFNPLNTPSNVLTNCLNGTLITKNGNENVLQNDMGNGRVETAFLPEGFIPLGTAELGGIVYVVSYNPLTNQSQIGSFPSPERNILTSELGESIKVLQKDNFYSSNDDIVQPRYKLTLCDKEINPGDKFQIFSNNIDFSSISAYNANNETKSVNKYPKYLKLHIVSVDKQGKITFLDDSLVWYDKPESESDNSNQNPFYIKKANLPNDLSQNPDLDEYRSVVTANYSVYTAKQKGQLAILAELECIDTFEVSVNSVVNTIDDANNDEFSKYVDLSFNLNWTYNNDDPISRNKINLYGFDVEVKYQSIYNDNNCYYVDLFSPNQIKKIKKESNNKQLFLKQSTIFKWPIAKKESNYSNKYEIDLSETLNINEHSNKKEDDFFYLQFGTSKIERKFSYDAIKERFRKNDGMDIEYESENIIRIYFDDISNPDYNPEIDSKLNELKPNKVTLIITPKMPFGRLTYLQKTITLDLSKIGKDIIDLVAWNYYIDPKTSSNNKITLNWGFDYYPSEGNKIHELDFEFYKLNSTNRLLFSCPTESYTPFTEQKSILTDRDLEQTFSSDNPIDVSEFGELIYKKSHNEKSYMGLFTDTYDINEVPLEYDQCYFVRLLIKYGSNPRNLENRYYFRFLYTSSIFNDKYLDVKDFCDIDLSECNKLQLKLESDNSVMTVGDANYYEYDPEKGQASTRYTLKGISDISETKTLCQVNIINWNINQDYKIHSEYDEIFTKIIPKNVNDRIRQKIEINSNANANYIGSILDVDKPNILKYSDCDVKNKEDIINIKTRTILNQSHRASEFQLITPFTLAFDREDHPNVKYKLVPLVITEQDLDLKLGHKEAQISYPSEDNAYLKAGDGKVKTCNLYGSEMSQLTKDLFDATNADVIQLNWRITWTDEKHGGSGVCVGAPFTYVDQYGALITRVYYTWFYSRSYSSSEIKDLFDALLIRSSSGRQELILAIQSYSRTSSNQSLELQNDECINWLNDSYKLVDYNETYTGIKYFISSLAYYNSYKFNLNITHPFKFELNSYKINELEVSKENENLKIPKNLNLFQGEIQSDFNIVSSSNQVNIFNITSLLNDNTEFILTGFTDDNGKYELKEKTDSITDLYDIHGNKRDPLNFEGITYNFTIKNDHLECTSKFKSPGVSDDYVFGNIYMFSEQKYVHLASMSVTHSNGRDTGQILQLKGVGALIHKDKGKQWSNA